MARYKSKTQKRNNIIWTVVLIILGIGAITFGYVGIRNYRTDLNNTITNKNLGDIEIKAAGDLPSISELIDLVREKNPETLNKNELGAKEIKETSAIIYSKRFFSNTEVKVSYTLKVKSFGESQVKKQLNILQMKRNL